MTTSQPRLMQVVARALERSDDAVLVLAPAEDDSARIVDANAGFSRMTGFELDTASGMALAQVLTQPAAVVAALRDGVALHGDLACRRRDGSSFWLGSQLLPGEAGMAVLIGHDIAAQKKAAEQERAVQHLLTRVFVGVDAAVAIATAEGRIQMTNPQFDRLVGSAPGRLIGYPTISLVAEESRDRVRQAVERHIRTGEAYAIDLRAQRLDGTVIDAHLHCAEADPRDLQRYRILTARQAAPAAVDFQVAGKVRLIGLSEVQAELGAQWPKLAARALDAAEAVIRRRLGPLETFSRTSDEGFVICFADRTEEEATFAAAMIAREVRQKLVGQGGDPRAAEVHAIVATLPAAPQDEAGQPALAAAEARGRRVEGQLNARRVAIEAQAKRNLTGLATTAGARLSPILSGDGSAIVGHYGSIAPDTADAILAAAAALPTGEREALDLHCLTLGLVARQILQDMPGGPPGMVMVDVGFDIFDSRASTEAYLAACRKLDPRTRDRLILVLHLPPDGIVGSRLIDCVQSMRQVCRGVSFVTGALGSVPVDLARMPAAVLVLHADRLAGDRWEERLVRFLATLHARRGRLMVHEVSQAGLVAKLREFGVDLISLAGTLQADGASVAA